MTKEEALEMLKYNSNVIHRTMDGRTDPREVEALDMAIEALEQKPVLDKIRAEIIKLQTYKMFEGEDTVYVERDDVLEIVGKYKEESEEEEWKN